MFKVLKTTENLLLLNEYLNWTEVRGQMIENGETYLILSSLPEKLQTKLRSINNESLISFNSTNLTVSNKN